MLAGKVALDGNGTASRTGKEFYSIRQKHPNANR